MSATHSYLRGLETAGLRDVRVTSRLVYDASQLAELLSSSAYGGGAGSCDGQAIANAATGKIWSARIEAVKG